MRPVSILALTTLLLAGFGQRLTRVAAASPVPQADAATPGEHDATPNDLAALAGKELHLTKLAVDGKSINIPAGGPPPTLQVQGEGQVMGRGPVNRYSGKLNLGAHGEMSWASPLRSTKMASTRDRMQLENEFMAAPSAPRNIWISVRERPKL